ncbi:MAG: hypothetical protein A2516_10600 [Alphaproteobacteria bacterium RIFOXYD12_FULL_60_8]|nr:MAG: hypothetical protein A2516_10600 [Alphaproteobacteria bacterium RIFOXYD12_FULL_60_8]
MFLIDSSALITAKNHYYQFDRVPQFWDWLQYQVESGRVQTPAEIYEEITKQDDELKMWAESIKDALIVSDGAYDKKLLTVLAKYKDEEGNISPQGLIKMGADPYLIACALHTGWTVVTGEVSAPKRTLHNRRIPDICDLLKIQWTNIHGLWNKEGLINLLDFKTNWKQP